MATTTTPTVPTTLLEAVNQLLQAIRVSSVMSLSAADTNEDASGAKQAIDTASIEAQSGGFNFNTENEVAVDPTPAGEIVLPSNVLKVRSYRWSRRPDRLVRRGARLYDPKKRTYNIGETVYLDWVVALPFEELPQNARMYVTAMAARRFCLPKLPTQSTFAYTEEYLEGARNAMWVEDAETEDTDLKVTSPHFAAMARR